MIQWQHVTLAAGISPSILQKLHFKSDRIREFGTIETKRTSDWSGNGVNPETGMALTKFHYSSEWETDLSGVVGFHPATMVRNLEPRDRMGAIKALVNRLHGSGYVTDSLRFLQSVLDREDLESTAVGNGIAFPHARCGSAAHLGMALGISTRGVDFHSDTHPEPVRLICLVAVPAEGDIRYLPLLGYLCRLFHEEFTETFLESRTTEEMNRLLLRQMRLHGALPEACMAHVPAT